MRSGDIAWLDKKRTSSVAVQIGGKQFDIRDQQPLYSGKTRLEAGWTFEELIRQLNSRIYFWPGSSTGPSAYGMRHFQRYQGESPVILRVTTAAILQDNSNNPPHFCKYNSGSPRTTQGKGSPRGPNTFLSCNRTSYTAGGVIEVTFLKSVTLPAQIESSTNPSGPWTIH